MQRLEVAQSCANARPVARAAASESRAALSWTNRFEYEGFRVIARGAHRSHVACASVRNARLCSEQFYREDVASYAACPGDA